VTLEVLLAIEELRGFLEKRWFGHCLIA
jgi:hypothetical protein